MQSSCQEQRAVPDSLFSSVTNRYLSISNSPAAVSRTHRKRVTIKRMADAAFLLPLSKNCSKLRSERKEVGTNKACPPSAFLLNTSNNCSLSSLQSKTSKAQMNHGCLTKSHKHVSFANHTESVRKENPRRGALSNVSVTMNAEASSCIELTRRRKRSRKYAWLVDNDISDDDGDDDGDKDDDDVNSSRKLMASNAHGARGGEGGRKDTSGPVGTAIKQKRRRLSRVHTGGNVVESDLINKCARRQSGKHSLVQLKSCYLGLQKSKSSDHASTPTVRGQGRPKGAALEEEICTHASEDEKTQKVRLLYF